MKKQTAKKLNLGKIKVASLSKASQENLKGGNMKPSFLALCPNDASQTAHPCSIESCRF